jgi:capsule polysaccharide modification protein KpsS
MPMVEWEYIDIECFNSREKAKDFLTEYKRKHPDSNAFILKRHVPMWRGYFKGQAQYETIILYCVVEKVSLARLLE